MSNFNGYQIVNELINPLFRKRPINSLLARTKKIQILKNSLFRTNRMLDKANRDLRIAKRIGKVEEIDRLSYFVKKIRGRIIDIRSKLGMNR